MRIAVVGGGVIGLTCATMIAEAGHDVTVQAREFGVNTTSGVAAAIWHPYHALPFERVTAWAAGTYPVLRDLAEREPASGIVMREGAELLREPGPDPWWAAAVPDLRRAEFLLPGYKDSYGLRTAITEMPIYLPWLAARAERAGAQLVRAEVMQWPTGFDAIVNATGLLGAALTGDDTGFPIRGQVVWVEQIGLTNWWVDSAGPTYLVPRSKDIVVGGTDVIGDWNTEARPETAAEILARAAQMVPDIAHAKVLAHRVGLRPGRPSVRLEREDRSGATSIVHCYGHGGAGMTLSWGCAKEVLDLVEEMR
ncbi:MAG: FAD-dependent oxidoreductase [Jatrophihabitans sp.]